MSTPFEKLCAIVAQLRAPGGCPWDREQTHESLLPATIEEAYEVAGAVRAKDEANFREELGDLLLLVVMHAEIAREAGRFNIDNVIAEITEKLIRRHPHVFAKSDAHDSGAVLKQWEAIKRSEKGDDHYLAGLPAALPALMRAQKAQKKVARVAFGKHVRMSPNQLLRDLRDDIVDVESPGLARDLGVHDHEQEKVAQFFPQIRFVFRAHRAGDFISFFDCRG